MFPFSLYFALATRADEAAARLRSHMRKKILAGHAVHLTEAASLLVVEFGMDWAAAGEIVRGWAQEFDDERAELRAQDARAEMAAE